MPASISTQWSSTVFESVIRLVHAAEERPNGFIPRKNVEAINVRDSGELGCLRAPAQQFASTGRLKIGHSGAVELHAFLKVTQQMFRRHDLGDDATGEGDNLIVEVFDAGIFDAFGQFLGRLGAGVEFSVQV
ncbi:hypothetical protein D3C75_993150 [compost metagenome]